MLQLQSVESHICSSDPVACIEIRKYAAVVRRRAHRLTLFSFFQCVFAELRILYSYMAIKCFSSPEPDYGCKSEITQRDGTNVSRSHVDE